MRIRLQGLPPWLSPSPAAAADAPDAAGTAAAAQAAGAGAAKDADTAAAADAATAATCSAAATAAENVTMKLIVREDQLALLYKRIAGM